MPGISFRVLGCWVIQTLRTDRQTQNRRSDFFQSTHTYVEKFEEKKKFNFETVFFLQKKGQQLPNFIHFTNSVTTIISLFIEIQNFEVGSYE